MTRPTYARARFLSCLTVVVLLAAAHGSIPRPALAQAQPPDRTRTEERLRALQQQIAEDEARLTRAAEAEQATMATLDKLNRQISLREELVATYRRRMSQMHRESDSLRTALTELEQEIGELTGEYASRARHAYMYGRLHDVALILAAESINQMLIRIRYLNRFADQRRTRLDGIAEARTLLTERRAALETNLAQNQVLLRAAEDEQKALTRLQGERRRVINDLRTQRSELSQSIETKRAAASELEQRIQALIAEERSRRRERAVVDPAEEAAFVELTGSFRQNRGRLPWPTEGAVVEPFGEVVNPVLGTTTPNPGVLIATSSSAPVRSVFDGQVISVDVMPGFGTYVLVEHGEYLSVYSNFSLLYVGEGDRVRAGQVIGRAGTDAEPKGRGLFFSIFQGGEPQNPVPWLQRR